MRCVLLALLVLTSACAPRTHRVAAAPAPDVQLRLATLTPVWVAGFDVTRAAEGRPEFDLNSETVRLVRDSLRKWSDVQIIEAAPVLVDGDQLANAAFWRTHGEDHGASLIVTGSVRLILAPPTFEQRGMRTIIVPASGRILDASVVVIDAQTGLVLSRTPVPARMRYGIGRFSSPFFLYLQMMQQALPDWLDAITRRTAVSADSPPSS
jgi:hypothetical protein